MKKIFVIAIIWISAFNMSYALLRERGIDPLNIDSSARPFSLSSAYIGLSDRSDSIFFNAAGGIWGRGINLTLGDDFKNVSFSETMGRDSDQTFAFGILNSAITDIPYKDGTTSFRSRILILSYSSKLKPLSTFFPNYYDILRKGSIGLRLKGLLSAQLSQGGEEDKFLSGYDLDLGFLMRVRDEISLGLQVENILPKGTLGGGVLKWTTGEEEIPTILKIGLATRAEKDFIICYEMDWQLAEGRLSLHAGAERRIWSNVALRAGIEQYKIGEEITFRGGVGIGVSFDSFDIDFALRNEVYARAPKIFVSASYTPPEWILEKAELEEEVLTEIVKVELPPNIVTYKDSLVVEGEVRRGTEVLINDSYAYVDENNKFSVELPLNIGKNFIKIDGVVPGRKKTITLNVLRKAKIILAEEVELTKNLKGLEGRLKEAKEKGLEAEMATLSYEIDVVKDKLKKAEADRERMELLATEGIIEVKEPIKAEAAMTRGELAIWIVKAKEIPIPKVVGKPIAKDILPDNPIAPYVKAILDLRLMTLYPDGTFRPGFPVTESEIITIVKRFQ